MANTKSSKKTEIKEYPETQEVLGVEVEATEKHNTSIGNENVSTDAEIPYGTLLVGTYDEEGNDTNADFLVTQKVFNKYFSNNSKFKIKKKA